jgi:hypothetical protein
MPDYRETRPVSGLLNDLNHFDANENDYHEQ